MSERIRDYSRFFLSPQGDRNPHTTQCFFGDPNRYEPPERPKRSKEWTPEWLPLSVVTIGMALLMELIQYDDPTPIVSYISAVLFFAGASNAIINVVAAQTVNRHFAAKNKK